MTVSPRKQWALGLGCDRGTPLATLQQAIDEALAQVGGALAEVVAVASIDLKSDEPCMLALQVQYGWAIGFYPASALAAVSVPNPSETVRQYTGTPSVSEAAALLAAGRKGEPASASALKVEKHKLRGIDGRNATVSIAQCTPG